MPVGFGSLEVARSGLYVNERGLFVTGHNISNVNTPGYTRQQAMIGTANYENGPKYQLGLGADIQQIRQIRHTFLDNMYRQETQPLGYWETRSKTFQDVQAILGEPANNGLQNTLNQFWDSWQELSKDPSSLTARALVRQRGTALSTYFNHLGSQFDKLQEDLNSEIVIRVNEVNSLTENIAKLNVKISEAEVAKDSANDLRDQRNLSVDKLCKLVDCQINEMQDGQIDLVVGGYFLVNKDKSNTITMAQNTLGSNFSDPYISGARLPVRGGILKGLLESRGEVKYNQGSTQNGSSYDRVDLVFAFNLNDISVQRDALLAKIDSIVKTYTDKGFKVNLGYAGFNGTGTVVPTTFATDINSFKTGISAPAMAFTGSGAVSKLASTLSDSTTTNDILSAITDYDATAGSNNTARQVVLFSNGPVDSTGIGQAANDLKNNDMHIMVVSDIANKPNLKDLPIITQDRFVDATAAGFDLGKEIIENVRNCFYGDVDSTKNIIPDLRERLNLLVNAIAHEVNKLHTSGFTQGVNSHAGLDFFVAKKSNYPMEMGNIQLNSKFEDLNEIVSSYDGTNGDNTVALSISDIRHAAVIGNFGNVENMNDFYQSIIMNVGNGGAEAQRISDSQGMLINSLDTQRNSISGVSMDEEMTNMMKYQYAYGASARVMNVLDEMFESIINRLGIVGR